MTGDDTENDPEQDRDAAAALPVPPAVSGVDRYAVPAPETVATPDAEAAIEGFEVPPPPEFEADPSPVIPEPVIPKSSTENAEADAAAPPTLRTRRTWTPNDTWNPASDHKSEPAAPTAAEKTESRAAASRAATRRDEATRPDIAPAASATEGHNYRGWTVAIYTGLAVLFFGAIGLMVFLGLGG